MKNVKIISAVMAMALAASLSGCKDNATPPPHTGSDAQSSLPIDASNSNLGSVSEPETSSEAPESTSSEPEAVTPYVPEDAYVPPESEILTTSPEVGGTYKNGNLTAPLVPTRGLKVRDDIKLNEVKIGDKTYDINQGMQVIEFCKEYGLSSNGGVDAGIIAYYDDELYNFASRFTFNCQPIFKEDPNSFKVKQGIDYTYTLYSDNGKATEKTGTTHNALSLETAKPKDEQNRSLALRDNKDDPIRAVAATVPVPINSSRRTNITINNGTEQGIYEELQAMMDAQLQVVFAGGITAGQTKETIDAYLGKGLEYKIPQESANQMFSYYKSKDATLVILYQLDEGVKTSKISYTKNNGYYAKTIMLFRNEQF